MNAKKLPGTFFQRNGRWYWSVTLPGQSRRQIPLKPKCGRFATKDYAVAVEVAKSILAQRPAGHDGTIDSLLDQYGLFCAAYYGDKGGKQAAWQTAALRDMYGSTLAEDFSPIDLQRVIEAMIDAGLARKTINDRIGRIKRAFKWAASKQIIPSHTYANLLLVEAMHKGRSIPRVDDPAETITPNQPDKRKAVPADVVEATLPHLSYVTGAMVQLQQITGMRSTEICIMRGAEIDRTGEIWIYRPDRHKESWREGREEKEICLGPRAQAILRPFLIRPPDDYLFSPAASEQDARNRRHEQRKTPAGRGNERGTNNRNIRMFRPCFTAASYRRAIVRAAEAAHVPHWFPHQLRHAATTAIRQAVGLEAAQALIGHSDKAMTAHYSREATLAIAREAAGKVG